MRDLCQLRNLPLILLDHVCKLLLLVYGLNMCISRLNKFLYMYGDVYS